MCKAYSNDEWYSLVYEPAINKLANYYDVATKNIDRRKKTLKRFIEKILTTESINKVIIMGNKYDGVDNPYYQDVLIPMLSNAIWVFYVYGENATILEERKNNAATFAKTNKLSFEIRTW